MLYFDRENIFPVASFSRQASRKILAWGWHYFDPYALEPHLHITESQTLNHWSSVKFTKQGLEVGTAVGGGGGWRQGWAAPFNIFTPSEM
jgi:hypothetical protein